MTHDRFLRGSGARGMGIHAGKDCGEDEGLPTVFGCAQPGCRRPTEADNPNTAGYVLIDELKELCLRCCTTNVYAS